jgi:hypothetical protein
MKLTILFVVVVGVMLVWWLRSVKPKRRICSHLAGLFCPSALCLKRL